MKKLFLISAMALAIAACGGNTKMDTDDDTTTVADQTEVADDTMVTTTDTLAITAPVTVEGQPVSAVPVEKEVPEKEEKKTAEKPVVAKAGSEKGGELIKASDCLTCHREDMKLVGPAYKDVAEKYKATAANIDMLADKVINGGAGNWGQIPMTPHPAVSKSDAKEMVKYILAVK